MQSYHGPLSMSAETNFGTLVKKYLWPGTNSPFVCNRCRSTTVFTVLPQLDVSRAALSMQGVEGVAAPGLP